MALNLYNLFSTFKKTGVVAPRKVVGIDVGTSAIKVVELDQSEETAPVLSTYGSIQLGPYAKSYAGATVPQPAEVATDALIDIIREAGVTAKTAVLSLPASAGFVSVVPITTNDEQELANKIQLEGRKYVPIPLTEVTLDWAPIHAVTAKGQTRQIGVLLVAISNEMISTYNTLLQTVGFSDYKVELSMFSISRCIANGLAQQEKAIDRYVVIDVGAESLKLHAYYQNELHETHRLPVGGQQITERLAEMLSVPPAQAEMVKQSLAPEQVENIRRTTTTVLEADVRACRHMLQKYEIAHEVTDTPVFVTGGGMVNQVMVNFVQDVLQRPVNHIKPFDIVGYPAFMEDTLQAIGPHFTIALGAARRYW